MNVSTHSRLKAAGGLVGANGVRSEVSTHSRLKAAAVTDAAMMTKPRFNTQPPEGG